MGLSRIEARFAQLKREGRAAFTPYVVAGDPDAETSWRILKAFPLGGRRADLIELGLPFSDPMADGPAVQRGAARALAAGADTTGVIALVRRFREKDDATPIILMGYYNPILTFGLDAFAAAAAAAGVDGLIMVDVPPEEADPLADALEAHDVALIRLGHADHRRRQSWRSSPGACAASSISWRSTGVTGGKAADAGASPPRWGGCATSSACRWRWAGIRTAERAARGGPYRRRRRRRLGAGG